MAAGSSMIETGVDKLISLIEKKKKISITDAAKVLSMPKVVVEEWASFLEEEGIITVDYRFSNAILQVKELSDKEVQRKTQEFVGKKEGFVRELEATLSSLDKEMGGLGKIKKEFNELAQEMESQVDHIEGELKTLEKFERLKTDLDKEIIAQEQSFREDIQRINRELESKKKLYEKIVENIEKDQISLDEEKTTAAKLMKEEDLLSKELERTTEWIQKIRTKIKDEKHRIEDAEKHMDHLKDYAEDIKKNVGEKEIEITSLVNKSKMQEGKIIDLQKEILSKFTKEKKKMDEDTRFLGALKDRFTSAFGKKKDILNLMNSIESELTDYRKDFVTLIKKAKIIQVKGGKKDVEKHIKELEKRYHDMEKRRENFEKEVKKLTSWLKNV